MAAVNLSEIAALFGLNEQDLYREALVSFLREKRREVLQSLLEILSRYRVKSVAELESKIAEGEVLEHPAWEDLIVAENLTARLEELDEYIARLRNPEDYRSD